MQPLATEASPRSVCAHCGKPLPPPDGTPTFVYGVGAVGYQSCGSCGAKWRYLWQDAPPTRVKPDRNPRRAVMLGVGAVIVLLVVGGFAFARSQRWNRTDAGATPTPTTSSAPAVTSPPSTAQPLNLALVAVAYEGIANPMRTDRASYMKWLDESATATPQFEVNQQTKAYVERARAAIAELEGGAWPAEIATEIDSLLETARHFIDDLEPVLSGQAGSPAYVAMITDEARAVGDADKAVQQRLGELQAAGEHELLFPE